MEYDYSAEEKDLYVDEHIHSPSSIDPGALSFKLDDKVKKQRRVCQRSIIQMLDERMQGSLRCGTSVLHYLGHLLYC